MSLTIGTRGSALALWQTERVAAELKRLNPGIEIVIEKIRTRGDIIHDVPLARIGGKGLFVKEIENALLEGKIDLAVHSLKDVPTTLPEGLTIGAVLAREDARDALVSRLNLPLAQLPAGARLGTSSLRRTAQLRAYRPDFRIVSLRGNVDTRLRKAMSEDYEAVVLAAAGLHRLGHADRITEILSPDVIMPAVGQGALAVEVRADDEAAHSLVALLNDPKAQMCTRAERSFLKRLGGGCQVPIAAYGLIEDEALTLRGLVASVDGRQVVRGQKTGRPDQAEELGKALAEELLAQGARELLNP